jgi:hypothetical protein
VKWEHANGRATMRGLNAWRHGKHAIGWGYKCYGEQFKHLRNPTKFKPNLNEHQMVVWPWWALMKVPRP